MTFIDHLRVEFGFPISLACLRRHEAHLWERDNQLLPADRAVSERTVIVQIVGLPRTTD